MEENLLKEYTLSKEKSFLWSYDGEKVFISKKDKYGKKYTFNFTNTEIDGLLSYIERKGRIPLGNSVSKVKDGTEKDGIGTYIYSNIEQNTSLVQTASQLVAILYNANVLHYNNKKIGMVFWINDMNWKEKLLV